jgi:hypothetical protein
MNNNNNMAPTVENGLPDRGPLKLPPTNKLLDSLRTPDRLPSPQPTHLNVPGAANHKILQEPGTGYVAPKFEGKNDQMEKYDFLDKDKKLSDCVQSYGHSRSQEFHPG